MLLDREILLRMGEQIRAKRKELGWTPSQLALKARVHPSLISRIEYANRSMTAKPLAPVLRALGLSLDGDSICPKPSDLLNIAQLIEIKLRADLKHSAISDRGSLGQARNAYRTRMAVGAEYARDLKAFDELLDWDRALGIVATCTDSQGKRYHLDSHDDLGVLLEGAVPNHLRTAAKTVQQFTRREGRGLRVSCAILVGPIATITGLRDDPRLGLSRDAIELEIEDASGVELMNRAATRGKGAPYDFLIVATGAFNFTLVTERQTRFYHPVLPIHYEEQVNLMRPGRVPRRLIIYHGSSGLDELLVRKEEFPQRLEVEKRVHFQSLAETLPGVDDETMVNVWAPISTLLMNRFDWARAGMKEYQSLICMYQHERFSKGNLVAVGQAFKDLFVYEWNVLRATPSVALQYVAKNQQLTEKFEIGCGLEAIRDAKPQAR